MKVNFVKIYASFLLILVAGSFYVESRRLTFSLKKKGKGNHYVVHRLKRHAMKTADEILSPYDPAEFPLDDDEPRLLGPPQESPGMVPPKQAKSNPNAKSQISKGGMDSNFFEKSDNDESMEGSSEEDENESEDEQDEQGEEFERPESGKGVLKNKANQPLPPIENNNLPELKPSQTIQANNPSLSAHPASNLGSSSPSQNNPAPPKSPPKNPLYPPSKTAPEGHKLEYAHESDEPILFTIANSNAGRSWGALPYREKFQWKVPSAPCHEFDLVVPDEREGHDLITLCIYRQRLDTAGGSGIITHEEDKHVDLFEQREIKVYGQVVGFPGSEVYGRLVQTFFYGEISLGDNGENHIYVVEEIKLLSKLFHQSRKLFHNIVEVVGNLSTTASKNDSIQYNSVVTRGSSLLNFMTTSNDNHENLTPMPVVVITTKHNSYITPGVPKVVIDEKGQMKFVSPGKITVSLELDGSILLTTKHRVYTFRPHGSTMMKEGVAVTTLQQKEGSLAISAVSNSLTYGCVLPSHSFSSSRIGGYLCKVCLAADTSFQEQYLQLIGRNNTSTIAFLSEVIDQVSWILRSVDWEGDGKPDNIGLDYDTQFSAWQYDDDGSPTISIETLDVLFESLASLDFSDCCLGIAYTLKKFPHDIYAKASSSSPSDPGGICTLRRDGISKNVILISAHSKSETKLKPLTASQLIYLTAHEIGKTFGSSIDTSGQIGCDTFQDEGTGESKHYLLWPDVFRPNVTSEEKSFSNCSKKAIVATLDSCKSSCFEVDLHPFCGNGVLEEGEECDCGSEHSCSKQVCCYGRTGKFPCRKTGLTCGDKSMASNKILSQQLLIVVLGMGLLRCLIFWSGA